MNIHRNQFLPLFLSVCVLAGAGAGAGRAQSIYEPYSFVTLAGSAGLNGSADNTGPAARFDQPWGVAVDGAGNVYVADTLNHTIRKISPGGGVTTLAGVAGASGFQDGPAATALFNRPTGVAATSDGSMVYVADYNNHLIRRISTSSGVVSTLAGSVGVAGTTDATGAAARFRNPFGVALDAAGAVGYVTDQNNQSIRRIDLSTGAVTTLAGSPGNAGSADGANLSAALFNTPRGIAVDSGGNVYVADAGNFTVRRILSTGGVSTLAGAAASPGFTDGTGGAARFSVLQPISPFGGPCGVAVDGAGNVYVTDQGNHLVRKITASGGVTTLAGLALTPGGADGAGGAARFDDPAGVAVDGAGRLFVADTLNHTIRTGVVAASCIQMTSATNKTVACGAVWDFDAPAKIVDACCASFSVSFSTVTNGFCPLTATRTWVVSDACGNTNTCSQTVTVAGALAFFPVTSFDAAKGVYSSPSGQGYIALSLSHSGTTPSSAQNDTALIPSSFPVLFPGANNGWANPAQTVRVIGSGTFTINLDLTHYSNLSPSFVFGFYNIRDEGAYSMAAFDAGGAQFSPPFGWNLIGNDDNALQGPAGTHLILNPATGSFSTQMYQTGVQSDAAFWNQIPPNTATIVITGMLQPGYQDGVGLYFAEMGGCCSSNQCITLAPAADKTVPCGSAWDFDAPTNIVDSCCANFSLSFTTVTNGACPRVLTRTWTIADLCGNTNTCSQTVTVVDTTPPVFVCATNKTVECGSVWSFDTPAASDACGGSNVKVSVLGTVTNGALCSQTITRTWLGSDECGNTNTCSQTVTVANAKAPVILCPKNIVAVSCASIPVFYTVTAADGCDSNLTVVCSPPSGSVFAPGATTTVFCVASNCAGSAACSFTVTVECPTNSCVPAPAGLVLWLPFDETNGSASANLVPGGNSGLQVGNPTVNSGFVGRSLGFDGLGQYVEVPSYNGINPGTNSLTIDAWIQRGPGDDNSSTRVIVDKRELNTDIGYSLVLNSGGLLFQMTSASNLFSNYRDTVGVPLDNQWHFVAVTLSRGPATSAGQFYLDGTPTGVFSANGSPGSLSNASPLRVGSSQVAGARPWLGGIDEVEIFSRALAPAEIGLIYNAGAAGKCKPACATPLLVVCATNKTVSCAALWKFDPPTATSCCGTNVTIKATGVIAVGANPQLITQSWLISDDCGNTAACSQTVTVEGSAPPAVCANATVTAFSAGATNDVFAVPQAASPSSGLVLRLKSAGAHALKGFDDCLLQSTFAHTFTNLPSCIVGATLEVRLKACGAGAAGDSFSLGFTTPSGSLVPPGLAAVNWGRYLGNGNPGGPGLFNTPWTAGTERAIILDLALLPNADGSATDLLRTLNDSGFLDLVLKDNTAVEYAILTLTTCCGLPDIVVSAPTNGCCVVVTYSPPPFVTNCSPFTTVCFPPSGTCFPTGTNLVECTATDALGQVGRSFFKVIVLDSVAPVIISCPTNVIACMSSATNVGILPDVLGLVEATDNCTPAGQLMLTQKPPAGTPVTGGLVTVTVTDSSGNSVARAIPVVVRPCCVPHPEGLTLWLTFDEVAGLTAYNTAGGNNGVLMSVTNRGAGGYVNGSLCSFGSNDFVTVAGYPAINPGAKDFTLDAWVKRDPSSGNSPPRILVDKRDPATGVGYSLAVSYGHPLFQMADSAGGFDNYGDTNVVPADNQWHFVAVTVSRGSTSGGRFYYDGLPGASFDPTLHPGSLNNSASFLVGNTPVPGAGPWLGCLDEVEMFNRALSALEVQSLFNARSGGKCRSSCAVPVVSSLCDNQSSIVITARICNSGPAPQTYSCFFQSASGPGCNWSGALSFTPNLNTVTVPAYSCTNIPVTIAVPADMPCGAAGCYQMVILPAGGTDVYTSEGSLRKVCNLLCARVLPAIGNVSVRVPVVVPFVLTSSASNVLDLSGLQVRVIGPDGMPDMSYVSLNGLAPGAPWPVPSGSLAPGGQIQLSVSAEFTDYSPGDPFTLVLEADLQGDGDLKPLASMQLVNVSPETDNIVSLSRDASGAPLINWMGSGWTLQESASAEGPWMDVAGATAPFSDNQPQLPAKFYRLIKRP